MMNSCRCSLRWFAGIVCRKMNCQKEYTALTRAVIKSRNCGLPVKRICDWTCRTLCWGSQAKSLSSLVIRPSQCHSLCFRLAPLSLSLSVCAQRSARNSWSSERRGRIVSWSHTGSARRRRRRRGPGPPSHWCLPGLRRSCAWHSHRMPALTELLR